MLRLRGRSLFVGRERERALLYARLSTGADSPACVLIGGEPGAGKTRLLAYLSEEARRQGWLVLTGRAYEVEGTPPYLPFVEALRPSQRGPAVAQESDLARLLPALARHSANLSEYDRYRMFDAVSDRLLALARSRSRFNVQGSSQRATSPGTSNAEAGTHPVGLLLALDDLQWADEPSLLLLRRLLRRVADDSAPLLVAGTYRTVELGRGHPFLDVLADLQREGLAEAMILRPFSPEESAALVEALSGGRPSEGLLSTLHRQSSGNAFYLTEIVRDLAAEGGLTEINELPPGWSLPRSVRGVIEKRLARLSPDALRLLQAGAVLGDGFRFGPAAAVAELTGDAVADALDRALTAGLVREEGDRLFFAHALIGATLLLGLNAVRRTELHRRALTALEESAGPGPAAYGELACPAARAGLTAPISVRRPMPCGRRGRRWRRSPSRRPRGSTRSRSTGLIGTARGRMGTERRCCSRSARRSGARGGSPRR